MRRPFDRAVTPPPPRVRLGERVAEPSPRRLGGWWTVAALVHLVALGLVLSRPRHEPRLPIKVQEPSQRAVGRALAEARRARQTAPKRPLKEQAPPKPPETQPRGPIVELAPGESQTPPPDAKRLAERDSRVDKESSARPGPRQERPIAPAPSPTRVPTPPAPPQPAPPQPPAAPKQAPPRATPLPRARDGERRAAERDKAHKDARPAAPRREAHRDDAPSQPGLGPRPPPRTLTLAQLIPSMGALAQQPGAPDPPTALGAAVPDIEEGGATLLNARAFRHAGYFNRLMRSVEQFWHPVDRYERIDPRGQMYGLQPRLTVVEVTLDGQGHLKDVRVLEPSGIYFLDDEATAAFRRAEPFNHPPAALVDASGTIRFSVGFHFRIQ